VTPQARRWFAGVVNLFHRRRFEHELDAELRSALAELAAEQQDQGRSAKEQERGAASGTRHAIAQRL